MNIITIFISLFIIKSFKYSILQTQIFVYLVNLHIYNHNLWYLQVIIKNNQLPDCIL